MNIVIANRQRTKPINKTLLQQMTRALLEELKVESAELGIALVGTKEMTRVNRQFLRHEGSTDVITFDHSEGRPAASGKRLHGELFICVDDAVTQARQFGTRWQLEVARYVIHGVLHLQGHDDMEGRARREMKRIETRLTRRLAKRFSLAQLSRAGKLKT